MNISIKLRYIAVILVLLTGCASLTMSTTTTDLIVHENRGNSFDTSKQIFINSGSDTVIDFSRTLKRELVHSGFRVTDRKKNAGYILAFEYTAKYDVYPWIILTLEMRLKDAETGHIVHHMTSDSSRAEQVNTLLEKAAGTMADNLILNRFNGNVGLTVDKPGKPDEGKEKPNRFNGKIGLTVDKVGKPDEGKEKKNLP